MTKIFNFSVNKYLIQTFFYTLSTLVANISNFILAIVFIYALAPEEYSKVVLLKASLIMITSLMSLGISQGVVRWVAKEVSKNNLLSSIIFFISIQSIISTLIYIGVILSLKQVLNIDISILLVLTIFILNLSMMLNNELLNWSRANQQSQQFSIYTFLRSLLQITSVVVFLGLYSNFISYLFGIAIAEFLLLFLLAFSLRKEFSFTYSKSLIFSILKYSWPHALIISSGFVLNYIDRFMLSKLQNDVSVIAYYDAASMLLLAIFSLASRPFNLFIFPAYTNKHKIDGVNKTIKFIEESQKYFVLILILLLTLTSFFSSFLLNLFFPENYIVASRIVPILSFGLLFNSLYVSAMAGLYISDKTNLIALASIIGIFVNIISNYLLIPTYGMTGAAVGTTLGFSASFIVGYLFAIRFLYIRLPFLLILLGFLVLSFALIDLSIFKP
tara:strand:+ start:1840 stop:3171 length:1332 start_codon:yes stop_codon:yes gene_type:complete